MLSSWVMFLRGALSVGLMIVVALAPLPLGSNRDWGWSPLAAVTGALLILQATSATHSSARDFAFFKELLVPAVLVGAVIAWILMQAMGWTPGSWGNPIREASRASLTPDFSISVALEREQALISLLRLLMYVGVFVVAADVCAATRTARKVFAVIVCSAVTYTLYAMIAGVVNQTTVATGISLIVPGDRQFTGPFVNRNNYATYAAIAALTAVAMATRTLGSTRGTVDAESTAQQWRRWLKAFSGRTSLWLAAAAILVVGVLLTGSRGGWACLTLGMMTMMTLLARGRRWQIAAGTLAALLVIAVAMPGGRMLLARLAELAETGEGEMGRQYLFDMTLHAIQLRPLLGWGANSFGSLYTLIQPEPSNLYYDKVHNTYLELAFDLGIPAAGALMIAVGWIAMRCLRGIRERRRDVELCVLGFCASVVVGLDALVDFSLQIPGVTVVYAALLGAAWAQSWGSRRGAT